MDRHRPGLLAVVTNWGEAARARAGLLDLRVGRRTAAALRSIAAQARALVPGSPCLVVLHGSRARGLARRGSDYDLALVVEGAEPSPSLADDLSDLCLPHVLGGLHVHAVPVFVPAGEEASPMLAGALRDGIAVEDRPGP